MIPGFLMGVVFALSLVWPAYVIAVWFKCGGGGRGDSRKIVLPSSMQSPTAARFPRRVP